jgi:hypothetical protein
LLYKILTGDRFTTAVIILLIAIGIWMPAFLSPEIVSVRDSESFMPFYSLLSLGLEGNLMLSRILAFGIMILEAVMLVRINAKFVLIQQRTFLPALFFVILAGHSPVLLQMNPVLPAVLFLLIVLDIIFHSYRDEPNSYRFFEAGIFLGLGSLFYAPLIYMLLFIWIANAVQRPFYWREYFFPFLGSLIPYIFVFAFIFFEDKSIPEFLSRIKSNFVFSFNFPEYHWVYWGFAIYLAFMILLAGVFMMSVFQFRKIYIRDYFMVLFWLFICGTVVFIFLSGFNTEISYIIAISVSYILANYFINARKIIANKMLLYLFLGYVIFLGVNNFMRIF